MNAEDNVAAAVTVLANRYLEVLDTRHVFGKLLDAVARATNGTAVAESDYEAWGRAFVTNNKHLLPALTRALKADDYPTYTSVSFRFAIESVPTEIEAAARRRAEYDNAVVDGLRELGLRVTKLITSPEILIFRSVWIGRDGGVLEVHEYDGLPVYVIARDDDAATPTRASHRMARIAALDDTRLDAERVLAAARRVWT